MRCHPLYLLCFLVFTGWSNTSFARQDDVKSFEKLRSDIFKAFANGDTATVALYHHPNVVKALAFDKLLTGRDAVIKDLAGTLSAFDLVFTEHTIESFVIEGNMATEISIFTMKGISKTQGNSFVFKGRSMAVYIRYKPSPAGWAVFREMVQPAGGQ